MCAIVVVIGDDSNKKALFCLNRLRHRGPDDKQIRSLERSNITVGFLRLAINDTTILGRQPFETKEYIGLFNAEIYNAKELKDKYKLQVNGESDTEVILLLFEKLHHNFIKELDGFFSGVIIHKETNEILIFRDYIGKKPLFMISDQDTIYFTSEMKAVNNADSFRTLPLGLSRYFDGKISSICKHQLNHNFSYSSSNLKETLQKAVLKRIPYQSSNKFGIFLSGGLDSSIIAALVHQTDFFSNAHFYYIADEKHSDLKYIELVIQYLEIPLSRVTKIELPTLVEIEELISTLVFATESKNPSIVSNGIGSYLLSKKAREDNIKVILTGDGADELFLGYSKKGLSPHNYKIEQSKFITDLHITELRRIDLSGMANSIEIRTPFLDIGIYETAINLSYEDLFGTQNSKHKFILREAFHNLLPIEIINRDKTSFDVGSGIQKLMVDFCLMLNITEIEYLTHIWNYHFSNSLSKVSDDPYFWAYPQFDDVIQDRGDKYER